MKKSINDTNDILNLFNLDYQELIVLFSLETIYVKKDIENTPSPKKELKEKWLNMWLDDLNYFFREVLKKEFVIFTNLSDLENFIKFNKPIKSDAHKYLMVLEFATFNPYYPLTKANKEENKKFSKLEHNKELKEKIVTVLKINKDLLNKFQKKYYEAIKILENTLSLIHKIAIGIGLGILTILFLPAALISLGTLLGIEALVTAGVYLGWLSSLLLTGLLFTIINGIPFVLVEGASIILFASVDFLTNPEFIKQQSAKLEVALEEIFINLLKDKQTAIKIVKTQEEKLNELKSELNEYQKDIKKQEKKNIEKSIVYLERALEHNKQILSKYGIQIDK